ncbi:complement factor H-like [Antennarius striatus]|uniref:complement factor H-like n=1 Tax=Antennarius striatus TaxID=241820 RepID=UPI0035B0947E
MNAITQTLVLLVWIHSLTAVTSQDCTLQQFQNSDRYDRNFDTANLQDVYDNGQQVRVGCNIGYSGFFKMICAKGKWEFKGSKCQPKSCGHPGEAQFADFRLDKGADFLFGSRVVYTCHKGYQMQNRINYRNCMDQGWDGIVPTCEAVSCPPVDVEDNIQVNGDLLSATYGNIIQFSCRSSKEILSGSAQIHCNENGMWSGSPPTCLAIKCSVPNIENGFVPGGDREYNELDVLYFMCNQGFSQPDSRPSRCMKTGTIADWIPTPLCEKTRCLLDPPVPGTSYDPPHRNLFSSGQKINVTCGENYWIVDRRQTWAESTCDENGHWSVRPVCKEVTCTRRQERNVYDWNIYYGQPLTPGIKVGYTCIRNYRSTDGSNEATCTRDGWMPKPLCQEIKCDRLEIQNADIGGPYKQEYKNHEVVYYVCKEGYEGSPSRVCRENGWTGNSKCTEIGCKSPEIEKAEFTHHVSRSYAHDEQVQYTCQGKSETRYTATCERGVWTGTEACTVTGCKKPEIENGFAVGPYNDKLYYTCNQDYKLFTKGGWGEAVCTASQEWSGLGQCIEKTKCGEIPVIPNGNMTQRGVYGPHETIPIFCMEGFLEAVESLRCQNGEWKASLLFQNICQSLPSNCKPPPKLENAVVVDPPKKQYLTDSEVTYECRSKFKMEGEAKLRCNNGTWENVIRCTPYCNKPKDVKVDPDKEMYKNKEVIVYQCGEKRFDATCVEGEWEGRVVCEAPNQEQ